MTSPGVLRAKSNQLISDKWEIAILQRLKMSFYSVKQYVSNGTTLGTSWLRF